jgi:hypothetical protein
MRYALALSIVAALALSASALGRTHATTLNGTVGPGYTIKLTKAGKIVRTLKPGRYRIVVRDRSSAHNFELEKTSGAEVEREITDVSAVQTRAITIRLTKGSWKVYCGPHRTTMVQRFTVK